jgi:hypothetical protein
MAAPAEKSAAARDWPMKLAPTVPRIGGMGPPGAAKRRPPMGSRLWQVDREVEDVTVVWSVERDDHHPFLEMLNHVFGMHAPRNSARREGELAARPGSKARSAYVIDRDREGGFNEPTAAPRPASYSAHGFVEIMNAVVSR